MRRTCVAVIALGTLSAATLSDSGVAQWVRDRGGEISTGAAGQITGLKLNFAWVCDADIDRLAGLAHLRALDLSFSLLTDAGIERLKPLAGVTDLNLYSVERITDVAVAYIRGWKNLERLNLRGTDVTDTALQYLAGFPALKALNVSHTQVTNNGMEYLPALRSLEEFRVGGNKVTGSGLRWLKVLPKLRLLDLNGTQKRNSGLWSVTLTDLDMETLGGFERLEELNLGGAKITDAGVRGLARLAGLRKLDLSRTQVSAKGIKDLAALEKLENLSLWRADNIQDDVAGVLVTMRNLKVLDLSNTSITNTTLSQLGSKPALSHLYLTGTTVTSAGIDAFQKSNPQCEVSWK